MFAGLSRTRLRKLHLSGDGIPSSKPQLQKTSVIVCQIRESTQHLGEFGSSQDDSERPEMDTFFQKT